MKIAKFTKRTAIAAVAAKLFFSSFSAMAEPPQEKAQLHAFAHYNITESFPAAGIGASYSIKNRQHADSKFLEVGLFALAGKKIVLDEAYLRYNWEDNWSKTTLSFLKNYSQKIGWGIEGGYFFGKSIKIGASATILSVPDDPSRLHFYLKPQIESEYKFLHATFAYLVNWLPGESPFAYAKGVQAAITASYGLWSIFGEYASLNLTRPAPAKEACVFGYWRTGIKYEF